ncbi:MAG: AEC family transporter [Oscillospiraceae bacterium]|nr:AEC family transporter [Oscillospiraceae bacterium]
MDSIVVFQQMLIFSFIMAIGFLVRRQGIIDETTNAHLTKLVLWVTFPATLISALFGSTIEVPAGEVFVLLGIIALCFVLMFGIALFFSAACRVEQDERGLFVSMAIFGNVTFMGIPLAYSLFGPDGMLYTVLFNVVQPFLLFSLGMKLIGGKQAKISIKFFLSPVLLAALTSVALFLLDIQFPYVINRSLSMLGAVSGPVGMIIIGSVLGGMNISEVFRGWRIYAVSGIRLVLMPFVVYGFLLLLSYTIFPLSPLFLMVMMVMVACPVAASISTFAIHYNTNPELASKGIFISTLFSVITMPLVLSFLF